MPVRRPAATIVETQTILTMNIAKIIGLGLLLALPAELRAADAATLEAIKKSGGLVLPYPGGEDLWEVEYHLRGRDLTDEGLAKLAALKMWWH